MSSLGREMPSSAWRSAGALGEALLILLIYLALGQLSYRLTVFNDKLTENFFIPAGYALALGLCRRWPMKSIVFIGQMLLALHQHLSITLGLAVAAAHVGVLQLGLLSAQLLRLDPKLHHVRDYLLLAAIEVILLQAASALSGACLMFWQTHSRVWLGLAGIWSLSAAGCQVILTSFLLSWLFSPYSSRKLLSWLASTCVLCLFLVWLIVTQIALPAMHKIALIYLSLLIFTSSYRLLGASTGALLLFSISQWSLAHGLSPLPDLPSPELEHEYIDVLVLSVALGMGLIGTLLNQLHEQALILQQQATCDELTGLGNRRYFFSATQLMLATLRRHPGPITLIMLDLDHFKRINDTYGHATGDQVLCLFAQALRSSFREGDLIARIGGEEFAILSLQGHPSEQCQRLRHILQESLNSHPNCPDFSFSSGSVTLASHEFHLDVALRAADSALYQAKRAGRHCDKMATSPASHTADALSESL